MATPDWRYLVRVIFRKKEHQIQVTLKRFEKCASSATITATVNSSNPDVRPEEGIMDGPHKYDPEHCEECAEEEKLYFQPEEIRKQSSNPFLASNIRPTQIQHARPYDC